MPFEVVGIDSGAVPLRPRISTPPPATSRSGVGDRDFADACEQYFECRPVQAAFGDDHVGVSFAGFDEPFVGRPNGFEILLDHEFGRATTFGDIATQSIVFLARYRIVVIKLCVFGFKRNDVLLKLIEMVKAHGGQAPPGDDITVVVVKRCK